MIKDELLASLYGMDLQEYKAEKITNERIFDELKKYEGTPSSKWPVIEFNWDLSQGGQRFSLDGISADDFLECYPDGFLLGYVNLHEFDKNLCHYSRRDEGELWELGLSHKLAYLIVYLSENRKISPPLIKPMESGEIIFGGGHHRYAIAKELKVQSIPIHVAPKYKIAIDSILRVNWENA